MKRKIQKLNRNTSENSPSKTRSSVTQPLIEDLPTSSSDFPIQGNWADDEVDYDEDIRPLSVSSQNDDDENGDDEETGDEETEDEGDETEDETIPDVSAQLPASAPVSVPTLAPTLAANKARAKGKISKTQAKAASHPITHGQVSPSLDPAVVAAITANPALVVQQLLPLFQNNGLLAAPRQATAPASIQIVNTSQVQMLSKIDYASVQQFEKYVKQQFASGLMKTSDDMHKLIDQTQYWYINVYMKQYKNEKGIYEWEHEPDHHWKSLDHLEFFRRLYLSLPESVKSTAKHRQVSTLDDLKQIPLDTLFQSDPAFLARRIQDISRARGYTEFVKEMPEAEQTKVIVDYRKFLHQKGEAFQVLAKMMDQANKGEPFKTLETFCKVWVNQMTQAHIIIRHAAIFNAFGTTNATSSRDNRGKSKGNGDASGKAKSHQQSTSSGNAIPQEHASRVVVCNVCGRNNHKAPTCVYSLAKHPDVNTERGVPFKDSSIGKKYFAKFNVNHLLAKKDLTFDEASQSNTSGFQWPSDLYDGRHNTVIATGKPPVSSSSSAGGAKRSHPHGKSNHGNKRHKGEVNNYDTYSMHIDDKHPQFYTTLAGNYHRSYLASIPNVHASDNFDTCLPGIIYAANPNVETLSNSSLPSFPCDYLPDTGALQDNYINGETAAWLDSQGVQASGCNGQICSGVDTNLCVSCSSRYNFYIVFINRLTNKKESIRIDAKLLVNSPYTLILGRPTLLKHNIIAKNISHFSSGNENEASSVASPHHKMMATSSPPANTGTMVNPLSKLSDLNKQIYTKAQLLTPEPDHDYIPPDMDIEMPWDRNVSLKDKDLISLITFEGSPQFVNDMKRLCADYIDIFSCELLPEPALLPPMELEVDKAKWHVDKHRGPARTQSTDNQLETIRQVNKMVKARVVAPSQATEYSQVLLTPKPGGKKRFCIDFRQLNLCCVSMGWPIPNIEHMIHRLGQNRSKFFGVLDLTSGYYQAPLSESSRIFTAFICVLGLFEWLRVPMGLKGAPSYFQQVMAAIVLVGLIYVICEIYIDDVIIYAPTEIEFLKRMEQVFQRFRKHKLTFNPEKVRLGLSRVEYVGHVLDDTGLSFTREKLSEVADFPKPTTAKTLLSFLGLAGYFRRHIRNYAATEHPMRQMLAEYKRSKRLTWTPEGEASYEALKKAICDCPKLYFPNTQGDVFLHTDASDYGIGAYLFQLVDGEEQPVAFLSRSLHKEQLRWSTPEKECYAIFLSFEKFKHLIQHIKFTLRTDHKNLTYLNLAGSDKVMRWKLLIQQYNFDIEHIPGKDNIVANGMSRFCPMDSSETDPDILCLAADFTIPKDKYRIISSFHNGNIGHFGVERTYNKIAAHHEPWQYMREHVRRFIKRCPCCQKMSVLKVPILTHPFTNSTYTPFERIQVDTVGPLPKDEYNNEYIIVCRDTFTRAIGLYAAPDTSAKHAARMLLQFIGNLGCPSQIQSDNGSQFVNGLIDEFIKLLGCENLHTLAYSKEENAIVERANKEVLRHLRNLIFDKRIIPIWSDVLPLVQRIIMNEPIEHLGVSPAQLLYGNAIDLDRGIFLPHLPRDEEGREIVLSEWSAKMLKSQAILLQLAEKRQRHHDLKHALANHVFVPTTFPINSYVLAEYPDGAMGKRPPTKFHPKLKGPFRVVNHNGSEYTVQNLVTNAYEKYHSKALRPFVYDDELVNPRDVAMRDNDEYVIEAILAHDGDPKQLRTLKFLVKWLGYPDSENTWEPWKTLRLTQQLHLYLRANGLQRLIPKNLEE